VGEHFFAGVAQLVEQLIRNQQVTSSSLVAGFSIRRVSVNHIGDNESMKTFNWRLWSDIFRSMRQAIRALSAKSSH
jgi:hypothetical protein